VLPPLAAVEKVIADLGLLPRAAASQGGNGHAGTLAKAIELIRAAQLNLPSVTELAAYLEELLGSSERFNGAPALPHNGSAVRLMNLHQAKGLEAPVVFLADPSGAWEHPINLHIDRSGPEVRGYLAVRDPDSGYHPAILACPVDWERLAEAERQFLQAEEQRLLYVAATRAGTQLTISQRSRYPHHNPWRFFERHLENCSPLQDPGPVTLPPAPSVTLAPTDVLTAGAAIAERWMAACRPSYVKAAAKELALSGKEVMASGCEHGAEWGTVIHQLLQDAMTYPDVDLRPLASEALLAQELDPALADLAVNTVRTVMASALWRRARAASVRLVETPFQLQRTDDRATDGVPTLLSGVIDLVFREADGWVLADYKTDAVPASKLRQLAASYQPQVALYADVWQQLTGETVKETGLYFTHLDRYVRLGRA
jgi:ATP-dependent helicase/nuclease subunit A